VCDFFTYLSWNCFPSTALGLIRLSRIYLNYLSLCDQRRSTKGL